MKLLAKINEYKKEYVFESYTRIIYDFKDYERVSRVKMVEEIYELYNSNHYCIDELCTEEELLVLKGVLEDNLQFNDKTNWAIHTLRDKFLLVCNYDSYEIPEEILGSVKNAISKVSWKKVQKLDKIHEVAVGICKVFGEIPCILLSEMLSSTLKWKKDKLYEYFVHNPLFHYYVYIDTMKYGSAEDDIAMCICQSYCYIIDTYRKERKEHDMDDYFLLPDLETYKTLFYNAFNVNNETVKKFSEELKNLPFLDSTFVPHVQKYALFNWDRTDLKDSLLDVPSLKNVPLGSFLKLLDEAMDEMPSGMLGGLTPNLYKEESFSANSSEKKQIVKKNTKGYEKQKMARLSDEDAALFFKLYFGLLEFVNNTYHVEPSLKKIYKQPCQSFKIASVIGKLWEDPEPIILEFCKKNPYHFTKSQLDIVDGFRAGIAGTFVIFKFEKEYTVFMDENKTYMVKGLYSNIDEVVSVEKLPKLVKTTLLPFKNGIISDGFYGDLNMTIGPNVKKTFEKQYKKDMKYYHL